MSIAVFDRAEGIELVERHHWYDDSNDKGSSLRPLLGTILDHYGFRIIEPSPVHKEKSRGDQHKPPFSIDRLGITFGDGWLRRHSR